MTFRFRSIAKLELAEAVIFYDNADPGRGLAFESKVKSVIDEIVAHPRQFSIKEGDTREAVVPGYPFCIYYRVRDQKIIITSVYHQSRDPDGWRGR